MNRPPLKPAAVAFLTDPPARIRTCEERYQLALALVKEGLVALSNRTVLGNGQVRYDVTVIAQEEV